MQEGEKGEEQARFLSFYEKNEQDKELGQLGRLIKRDQIRSYQLIKYRLHNSDYIIVIMCYVLTLSLYII